MSKVAETLRIFFVVAMPYFRSEDRLPGRLLLAAVVGAELGLVYVAVLVTQWNARFFNALEARNWDAFQAELVTFCFIAVGAITATMSQYYFGQTLQIRWRRWMTDNYVSVWMAEGRHYRVRFVDIDDRQHSPAHRQRRLSVHSAHPRTRHRPAREHCRVAVVFLHSLGAVAHDATAAVRHRPFVSRLPDRRCPGLCGDRHAWSRTGSAGGWSA